MTEELSLEEQLLSKLTALECWAARARRKCNLVNNPGFLDSLTRCRTLLTEAEVIAAAIEKGKTQ